MYSKDHFLRGSEEAFSVEISLLMTSQLSFWFGFETKAA